MKSVDAQQWMFVAITVIAIIGAAMVGCRRDEPEPTDDALVVDVSVVDEKPISANPSEKTEPSEKFDSTTPFEKSDSAIPSDVPVAQTMATAAQTTTEITATATTQAAAELDAPWQPLLRAKPGDWVEYQSLENLRLRYEVQKVTSSQVTTQVTVHQAGRDWGTPAFREDPIQIDFLEQTAMRNKAERTRTSATIEAASRHWECWLYEDRWSDEEVSYIRRSWVSSQVPYSGLIRMELHGDDQLEARLELVAYGMSAPAK